MNGGSLKDLFAAKRKPRETRTSQPATPRDVQWVEKNVPCQKACPAGTDIPAYLTAIANGDPDEAYRINLRDNIFPAILGRVCSRPCEAACRHGREGLGDSVAICFSKRSAADFLQQNLVVLDPWFETSGKRVAVVGGGVAGLATARQLALCGHAVVVHEKHDRPGGMLNQGIPKFRLPRRIIDHEIEQIKAQGVEIVCNSSIGKEITLSALMEQYDAVVMAAGTLDPNLLDLPGRELEGIRHGLDFLMQLNTFGKADMGERVIVIGGGFTAMDCARTAVRLGANTKVCYRRGEAEMLVTPGELEELGHEQIPLEYMVAPKAYIGTDGRISAMRFVRTKLDNDHRPVEIEGSEFEVPVDTVLLATGQSADMEWIDEALRNGHAKLFSAGDFSKGASSLIEAIADGKQCARSMDTFLMGEERLTEVVVTEVAKKTGRTLKMDEIARQPMPSAPLSQRDLPTEVERGYDETAAVEEAKRCYRCHYKFEIDPVKCILCDWCLEARIRPECILPLKTLQQDEQGTVVGWEVSEHRRDRRRVWINEEECIRCGACVTACPVDAITLHKVSIAWTKPTCPPRVPPICRADQAGKG
ncbi:MAG: FAD-dependent oxidoreductase [Verrucomicrobia bacterium]|nr:FAD-dependent oxidoreductase [Verrucomicrobiota bacterium]